MNVRLPAIILAIASLCSCGGVSPTRGRPSPITSRAAAEWIASPAGKPVILDVRTRDEFDEGHIAGAKLIPWTEDGFESRATKELARSQPLLVYCRSGKRSAAAADKLVSLGFTDVRPLQGGTLSWRKEGLPLTR